MSQLQITQRSVQKDQQIPSLMHSKLNFTSLQGWTSNPPLNIPTNKTQEQQKRFQSVINTESTVGDRILTVHSWENLPRDNGSHFHIKLYLSRWKMLKQNTGFLLAIFIPHSFPKTFQTCWVLLKIVPTPWCSKGAARQRAGMMGEGRDNYLPLRFQKINQWKRIE